MRIATKGLTPRQTEIANYIASGCSQKEVADRLGTQTPNVVKQICLIYEKTGLKGMSELAVAWVCFLKNVVPDFDTIGRISKAVDYLRENSKAVLQMLVCVGLMSFYTFVDDQHDITRSRKCRNRRSEIELIDNENEC